MELNENHNPLAYAGDIIIFGDMKQDFQYTWFYESVQAYVVFNKLEKYRTYMQCL